MDVSLAPSAKVAMGPSEATDRRTLTRSRGHRPEERVTLTKFRIAVAKHVVGDAADAEPRKPPLKVWAEALDPCASRQADRTDRTEPPPLSATGEGVKM